MILSTYQIAAAVVSLLFYNLLAVPLTMLAGDDLFSLSLAQLTALGGGLSAVDWLIETGRLRRALAYLDGR